MHPSFHHQRPVGPRGAQPLNRGGWLRYVLLLCALCVVFGIFMLHQEYADHHRGPRVKPQQLHGIAATDGESSEAERRKHAEDVHAAAVLQGHLHHHEEQFKRPERQPREPRDHPDPNKKHDVNDDDGEDEQPESDGGRADEERAVTAASKHAEHDPAAAERERVRVRALFTHTDALCGAGKKPERIKVVLHQQHGDKPATAAMELRPPVDLERSVLDTVTSKHPRLWPALHDGSEHHESGVNNNKDAAAKHDDAATATLQHAVTTGAHVAAVAVGAHFPHLGSTPSGTVLQSSGVFCVAVADDAASCPRSMGVLTVGAAARTHETHGRDASEFAVFPFHMVSVHDVDAAATGSIVSAFATCAAPDAVESRRSVISLQCKAAASAAAANGNSSAQKSDSGSFRLHWPQRIPRENPFLPVLLVHEEAERGMQRASDKRAVAAAVVSSVLKKKGSSIGNSNASAPEVVHADAETEAAAVAANFRPPQLTLSFLERAAVGAGPQGKKRRSKKRRKHHGGNGDPHDDDDDYRASEASGVLINGRGVTKLLLDPEEGGDSGSMQPRSHKGELAAGVIHSSILSSTASHLRATVPLEQFDHQSIRTAAEFVRIFASSSKGSDNNGPLVHVAASLTIETCGGEDDAASRTSPARLVIPAGTVIAADRGVVITFRDTSRCSLRVDGTSDNPVLFINARRDVHWGGLVFLTSASSPSAVDDGAKSKRQSVVQLRNLFVLGTGGVKATVKGVGTHIKDACPAFVAGPFASVLLDSVYVIDGRGSGITAGRQASVTIRNSVFFDLAQGGEFVGSSTLIERTHALHFQLRERHDEFRDDDNDGFYFRDGVAHMRDTVVYGARDDCVDTASSKNNRDLPATRLIIENSLLANCQHEGLALSGSVGAANRTVQILDSTIKFAQQAIENGHSPAAHSTLVEGVNIEDCGVGVRLGDNYVLDVDGPLEVGADVAIHRCQMPFLNLLRTHKHRVWQVDGRAQDPGTVRVHPETVVDGAAGGAQAYKHFCGREMFSLLSVPTTAKENREMRKHEQLLIL